MHRITSIRKNNRYSKIFFEFLKEVGAIIEDFENTTTPLKEKLALFLLQLSPRVPYDLDRLEQAISAFSHPRQVVVEFRHAQWITPDAQQLLTRLGAIFCDVDSPDMHFIGWLTSKIAYIRLHGRSAWYDHNYSKRELRDIVERVRRLEEQGAQEIYIFFNNDSQAYAPRNALTLMELL